MAKSLKQKNQPQLITFVVSNAVALGAIAFGLPHFVELLQQLSKGDWRVIGKIVAVPAFLTLVTGTIGWAMPRAAKEFLVFWRMRNCLPSSRAFTDIAPRDPRIDMQCLVSRYAPIPELPAQQTALWYRIYRGHRDDASVEDAHSAYLRFREMTTLTCALMLVYVLWAIYFGVESRRLFGGILLLMVEYLVVMVAARNAATRLVLNVLAIDTSTTSASTSA